MKMFKSEKNHVNNKVKILIKTEGGFYLCSVAMTT